MRNFYFGVTEPSFGSKTDAQDRKGRPILSPQTIGPFYTGTARDAVVGVTNIAEQLFACDAAPFKVLAEPSVVHRAALTTAGAFVLSCIYPKFAPQPISEDALLTGSLEPTNEWYAIAKIAGIKLAQAYRKQHGRDFISAMPTNLYGPGDNFSLTSSHVLPALIRKAHEAKLAGAETMTIWGTGTPRREFLHVDDLADACVYLLQHYSGHDHVNVGCGEDIAILELNRLVNRIVGFSGEIVHDLDKPDGTPRKLLDTTRLTGLGWRPSISLEEGIAQTYQWFLENVEAGNIRETV